MKLGGARRKRTGKAVAVSHVHWLSCLALFLELVMSTMMFNLSHLFTIRKWLLFPKPNYCNCKCKEGKDFSKAKECVDLWLEWSRSGKKSWATGVKRQSSARSADAWATPGWPAKYINKWTKEKTQNLCVDVGCQTHRLARTPTRL